MIYCLVIYLSEKAAHQNRNEEFILKNLLSFLSTKPEIEKMMTSHFFRA